MWFLLLQLQRKSWDKWGFTEILIYMYIYMVRRRGRSRVNVNKLIRLLSKEVNKREIKSLMSKPYFICTNTLVCPLERWWQPMSVGEVQCACSVIWQGGRVGWEKIMVKKRYMQGQTVLSLTGRFQGAELSLTAPSWRLHHCHFPWEQRKAHLLWCFSSRVKGWGC